MRRQRISGLAVSAAAVVLLAFGVGSDAGAGDGDLRLRADMSGDQEVPPADPDGRGRGRFDFRVDGDQLCFRLQFDDVGTPNRGHIHVGPAGVNGGIVVPLFELADMPADERNDALEEGGLEGCVEADPAVLAQIAADPDGYYCNLHNSRFPGGAIRGQLG